MIPRLILIGAVLLILMVPVNAFSPELLGDRNLGQEYKFTVNNVTTPDQSLKGSDVTYHWTVYDYRILGRAYSYYSNDWGRWFTQYSDHEKKYLALWVRVWMEGGSSWYGWGPDRFKLWIGNTTISNETIHLNDLPIEYKGDNYRPVVIAELQNLNSRSDKKLLSREWYGWKDEIELDRQEPGLSNAWDGFIIYQIPAAVTENDIRVFAPSWYGYGIWHLTPHQGLKQVRPATSTTNTNITDQPALPRGVKPKATIRPEDIR